MTKEFKVIVSAPVLAYARQHGGELETGIYELVRLRFGEDVQASAHLASFKPRYQKPITERLLFNALSQWGHHETA